MPTKRIFDLILIVGLALHPAVGLAKLEARRLAREKSGVLGTIGTAGVVVL